MLLYKIKKTTDKFGLGGVTSHIKLDWRRLINQTFYRAVGSAERNSNEWAA